MKQFFKLSEHKNDKNTAFAGSLHSAAWLGALALLQSQSSTDALVQARQGIMRSDIWFRQPVRSDFEVLSESVQQTSASAAWHINNVVQDEEGVKVEAVHQAGQPLPDWAVSPRVHQLQALHQLQPQQASVEVSEQQAQALRSIQEKMQTQFAVVSQSSRRAPSPPAPLPQEERGEFNIVSPFESLPLPPLSLLWCRTANGEPGLQVQLGTVMPITDQIDHLRLQVLLGYLAGWSFVSSLTSTTGEVDVLVSRVFAVAKPSGSQVELTSPLAILNTPNSEAQFLHHLQTYRSARAEVLVQSGHVLMKGLFHVRYV